MRDEMASEMLSVSRVALKYLDAFVSVFAWMKENVRR